jgi:glutamate synthase domain-containing protein 3
MVLDKFVSEDCDCGEGYTVVKDDVVTIDCSRDNAPIHFKELNCAIRKAMGLDCKIILLRNVTGQRYIAATAKRDDLYIGIYGTPGNNLGAFLDGPTIEVFGNAQDMTGNTMNSGKIIIHGNAWDVTGLSARGGKMFIEKNSGYRVGIHMKEYAHIRPTMVIGGTVKDYLGEYMAGGMILVLGQDHETVASPVGINIGAGIHGGKIIVKGHVGKEQLGPGAVTADLTSEDQAEVASLVEEFNGYFGKDVQFDSDQFTKVMPASSRPFSGKYDKTNI